MSPLLCKSFLAFCIVILHLLNSPEDQSVARHWWRSLGHLNVQALDAVTGTRLWALLSPSSKFETSFHVRDKFPYVEPFRLDATKVSPGDVTLEGSPANQRSLRVIQRAQRHRRRPRTE